MMPRPNFSDSASVKPGGTVDLRTTAHSAFPMAAKTDSTMEVSAEPSGLGGVGTHTKTHSAISVKSWILFVVDRAGFIS